MDTQMGQVIMESQELARLLPSGAGRIGRHERTPALTDVIVSDLWLKEPDGTDPRERLTNAQTRLLRRLVRGEDLVAASRREGVHIERAKRWVRTPRFQRARYLELATSVMASNPTPGMRLLSKMSSEGGTSHAP